MNDVTDTKVKQRNTEIKLTSKSFVDDLFKDKENINNINPDPQKVNIVEFDNFINENYTSKKLSRFLNINEKGLRVDTLGNIITEEAYENKPILLNENNNPNIFKNNMEEKKDSPVMTIVTDTFIVDKIITETYIIEENGRNDIPKQNKRNSKSTDKNENVITNTSTNSRLSKKETLPKKNSSKAKQKIEPTSEYLQEMKFMNDTKKFITEIFTIVRERLKKRNSQITKEKKKSIEKKKDSNKDNSQFKTTEDNVIFPNKIIQKNSIDDKVSRIQGFWKMSKISNYIGAMRDKAFIIQRCFRKFLVKKYELPDNYYYNEKFLKLQHDKFEKIFIENIKYLFPSLVNNSKNNLSSTFTNYNAYENEKIHLFAKILDVDFMVESDEVYEINWSKAYDKLNSICLKTGCPIQNISIGCSHTICVNSKGKVYSYGWNNYGQCGIPINSTIIEKNEVDNDYFIELTEFNHLKCKVLNKIDYHKQPQMDELIFTKNISCGEDHSLLLDSDGNVWSFGFNLNGQLGLGHTLQVDRPNKIKSFKNKIIQINSEDDVNFAVDDKGDAYMWPYSDKNGNVKCEPLKMPFNDKIQSISCGHNFALFLSSFGGVYSMGKTNMFGQLGHGDLTPRLRPSLIEFFPQNNERISTISCGYKHCAALSLTGKTYTWGLGVKGQLGHGDFDNCSVPYQIKLENAFIKIIDITCGFRNTYILTENRKLYFTGCNYNTSMQNSFIIFSPSEKIPEMGNEYYVVRIHSTWNKSMSFFYATIADTSLLKNMNNLKINNILNTLNSKWDRNSMDIPYIESIAKYFPSSLMRKNKDIMIPRK